MAQEIVMWTFMVTTMVNCLMMLFFVTAPPNWYSVVMFKVAPFITFVVGAIISLNLLGVLKPL